MVGENFVHFFVPRHRLGHPGLWVAIPTVLPTVANQHSPLCFELANQGGLLHPTLIKLGDSADARNLAARLVPEEITEVLLQFR